MTQLRRDATAHELSVTWPMYWAWQERQAQRDNTEKERKGRRV